jgi:hypothetical protein
LPNSLLLLAESRDEYDRISDAGPAELSSTHGLRHMARKDRKPDGRRFNGGKPKALDARPIQLGDRNFATCVISLPLIAKKLSRLFGA